MREIHFQVYKLSELPEETQEKAIEAYRDHMMEAQSDMALDWSVDDCSLFEPKHEEMAAILGGDYYERNSKEGYFGQFVFKNLRKGLCFDLEYGRLDYADALEITNREMFLLWLGIPEHLHHVVDYEIENGPHGTRLMMVLMDSGERELIEKLSPLAEAAEDKFLAHNKEILSRIQSSFDYYFSDESIKERIEEDGVEFFQDGKRYTGKSREAEITI